MCILFLWTTVPPTAVRDCLWISCGSPQNVLWRKSSHHTSTFDSYPHNFVLLPLLLPKPMDRNKYLFLSDKNAHRVLTALWIKTGNWRKIKIHPQRRDKSVEFQEFSTAGGDYNVRTHNFAPPW